MVYSIIFEHYAQSLLESPAETIITSPIGLPQSESMESSIRKCPHHIEIKRKEIFDGNQADQTKDNSPKSSVMQIHPHYNGSRSSLERIKDNIVQRKNLWSHLGMKGNPGRQDNFFSCKHLVSSTRDETTRTENACTCYNQSTCVLQEKDSRQKK